MSWSSGEAEVLAANKLSNCRLTWARESAMMRKTARAVRDDMAKKFNRL